MSEQKTDRVLLRAKDVMLLLSCLALLGWFFSGGSKIESWDRAAIVADKAANDVVQIRQEMAVQTAILSRMERSLERMSRSRSSGGD